MLTYIVLCLYFDVHIEKLINNVCFFLNIYFLIKLLVFCK